jgi:hypothetical protein
MARVRSLLALAALLAVVASTSLAHATVVVPLTLAQQVAGSDLIVRAHVGSMQSRYVAERGTILTWTELSVTEVLKGQASGSLLLRQMGGTADGQTMLVPGDAHLTTGDDVILFLRRDPSGGSDVLLYSLAQSAWFVDGQQAARDLSQLTFAVLGGPEGTQLSEPGHEASIRVDALATQIRSLVGGAR